MNAPAVTALERAAFAGCHMNRIAAVEGKSPPCDEACNQCLTSLECNLRALREPDEAMLEAMMAECRKASPEAYMEWELASSQQRKTLQRRKHAKRYTAAIDSILAGESTTEATR